MASVKIKHQESRKHQIIISFYPQSLYHYYYSRWSSKSWPFNKKPHASPEIYNFFQIWHKLQLWADLDVDISQIEK